VTESTGSVDHVPVPVDAWGPPRADEYAPFYAGYVARVPHAPIPDLLRDGFAASRALLEAMPEQSARYRYAPGKWSVKEIVGHMADSERVLAYRALRFARGDTTPLPGFDENHYVAAAGFDDRALDDLLAEWASVRDATRTLAESLNAESLQRVGTANEAPCSVRALLHIIVGHELHHRAILAERYGIRG